ncbi:hypothetical protein EVAR_94713_1 [Eumeta japonica]|uniref:Uncharacterized protein n=1 Tax=Eumeta variegata TaxID=151549 RepID=A0A4C1UVL4_EUMVA|nr:hypothetical protein EVAR_94713_1 [Eumeta japonica]
MSKLGSSTCGTTSKNKTPLRRRATALTLISHLVPRNLTLFAGGAGAVGATAARDPRTKTAPPRKKQLACEIPASTGPGRGPARSPPIVLAAWAGRTRDTRRRGRITKAEAADPRTEYFELHSSSLELSDALMSMRLRRFVAVVLNAVDVMLLSRNL